MNKVNTPFIGRTINIPTTLSEYVQGAMRSFFKSDLFTAPDVSDIVPNMRTAGMLATTIVSPGNQKFWWLDEDLTTWHPFGSSDESSSVIGTSAQGTFTLAADQNGTSDPTNNKWFTYQPSEIGAPAFNIWNGAFDPQQSRRDQVFRMGWNLAGGGQPEIEGYGALGIEMESYFEAAHPQQEFHLKSCDADGYETRFLSYENHLDDGSTALYIATTAGYLISGRTSNDPARVIWGPSAIQLNAESSINAFYADNQQTWINSGDLNRSRVTLFPDGEAYIKSTLAGGWTVNGTVQSLFFDADTASLTSPSGTQSLVFHNASTLLTATATHGTLSLGTNIQGADATNNLFLKYQPAEAGSVPWVQWAGTFNNGTWARKDQVMRFGWNVGAGGGLINTGDRVGGWSSEYESSYEGGHYQMERHEVYWDPTGAGHRIWSCLSNLESPYDSQLFINVETISLGGFGAGISVTAANAGMNSPSGTNTFYVDNSQIWMRAAAGAALFEALPDGEAFINANLIGYLQNNNNTILQWGSNYILSNYDIFMGNASASSGTHLKNSTTTRYHGSYWNGSDPTRFDAEIQNIMDSTGPTAHFSFQFNETEVAALNSTGTLTLPFTDSNGPYTNNLSLGGGDQVWLKIAPGDPGRYVDFYGTFASFTNSTFRDDVWRIGHNAAAGGGAVIAGRGALSLAMESYFTGGHPQQELHITSVDTLGVETRLFSAENHLDDNTTALFIASGTGQIGSGHNNVDSNGVIRWAASGVSLLSPDGGFQFVINNSQAYLIKSPTQVAMTAGNVTINGGTVTLGDSTHAVTVVGALNVNGSATIGIPATTGSFVTNATQAIMDSPGQGSRYILQDVGHSFQGSMGFFGVYPPIAQPSSAGDTTQTVHGSGASVLVDSTSTGGIGTTAYTLSDMIKHLKQLGLLAL